MESLSEQDKQILMALEYEFPLDKEPFKVIAQRFGLTEAELLEKVKNYVHEGVVKRIGMYVSFRAKGMDGALVAAQIPENKIEIFRKKALGIKEITHNYIRIHPKYNVWYVIKAENRKLLTDNIRSLMEEVGAEDYVILFSERTIKLSVKYDVIRGISYSEPLVPRDEGRVDVDPQVLKVLSYPLPLVPRPFKEISQKLGMSEDDVLDIIRKLKERGAIRDYGATLNGEKVGITENGMLMVSSNNLEETCESLASVRETTHVVLRSSDKPWDFLCYAMLHAKSKKLILDTARKIVDQLDVKNYMILFSTENLKPGIVI